jgi:hypothetical protein
VQSTVKMKPARSPLRRHPTTSRGQVPGGGPQCSPAVVKISSTRTTRHPAEARCRAEARRVKSMVQMKLGSPASAHWIFLILFNCA